MNDAKDAARYRFLKGKLHVGTCQENNVLTGAVTFPRWWTATVICEAVGDDLDKSIDAALRKGDR